MSERSGERWLKRFEEFSAFRAGAEPAWLQSARKMAMARFAELGFPSRAHEDWKYTNLAPIAALPARLAQAPRQLPSASELDRVGVSPEQRVQVTFLNGRFAPELSRIEQNDGRVEVTSLARRIEAQPGELEPYVTRCVPFEDQAFVALNTAFFSDGAFIHARAGAAPAHPILLRFVTDSDDEAVTTVPRVLVVADPGSHLSIVETYVSLGGATHHTNAVTEIEIGEDASLAHCRLQSENPQSLHVSTLAVRQGRHSRFSAHAFSFGAALARNDVIAAIGDEGAECTLNGLYLTGEDQHVDNHTLIDHRQPHGTSRELYKGILAGASRGVFNGRILVRPHAQRTDARQKNDNLLLSDRAEIDTKPQLEIHADDVKCSHGSTIGHLSEEPLFYLRTRGLSEPSARKLLMRGFASEVVDTVPIEGLRQELGDLIARRLDSLEARPETS